MSARSRDEAPLGPPRSGRRRVERLVARDSDRSGHARFDRADHQMPAAAAAAAGGDERRRTGARGSRTHFANIGCSELISSCGEDAAMHVVVGPIVTRDGGFAFDSWTPDKGLTLGYAYRRIEDAHYARRAEIRSRATSFADP